MPGQSLDTIRGYLRRFFSIPAPSPISDQQLLEQFAGSGDQAAFAVIVQRHGPMVLGICRRVLGDSAEADDAFQATFLVLLQKAGSLSWRDSVAGWLYEVASRITHKTRANSRRSALSVAAVEGANAEDPVAEASRRELRSILDEEILRLPAKYRTPLILHYFQGQTKNEVARHLGWTEGTVSGRLARARDLLRGRLTRRGLAPSTSLFGTLLENPSATAAVPSVLQTATLRTAALFIAGKGVTAGALSASVAALAQEGLQTMSATKLKILSALFLVALLGGGVSFLTYRKLADQPGPPIAKEQNEPIAQPPVVPAPLDVNSVLAEAAQAIRQAPGYNIHTRARIASAQAETGNREAAAKMLREVLEMVDRLPEKHSQALLLPTLAIAEKKVVGEAAARKTFQRALQIAQDLQSENGRVDATQLIARVLATTGDFAGAREAAAGVTPEFYRAQVLGDIAVEEAKVGNIKEALEHVETIPSSLSKSKAWAEIAVLQARAGDRSAARTTLQRSLQAAEKLEDENHKPHLLDQIALVQVQIGTVAEARKSLAEASALAKRRNVGHQTTLIPLALTQAESGDREGAQKTLDEVLKAAPLLDPSQVPWDGIAKVHLALGDLRVASEIIEREARDPRYANWSRGFLSQLAEAQAEGGDAAGAYAWASQENEPLARATILLSLAEGMIQRNQASTGRGRLKELISVPVRGVKFFPGKPKILHDNEFQLLSQEYEQAIGDSNKAEEAAKTKEEREKVEENSDKFLHNFARRMLALAEKYPDEPVAMDALEWVVQYDYQSPTAAKAFALLAHSHAESQTVGRVCNTVPMNWPLNSAEKFLRAVLAKNKDRALQGRACLNLAEFLRERAEVLKNMYGSQGTELKKQWANSFGPELVKELQETDREKVLAEAESLLERVVKQYADVKLDDERTLGEIAERHLFEMRHLTVGNPALEIEGEDLDGKPLKLSEQRGKVVVLNFWFSTCNPCRVKVPHQRELVERLKDKPFVLLGINNDEDRDKAKAVVQKDQMSWRSWWDGDRNHQGPIATRWNVSSWPTVYILDHKGIIRYKNVSDKELDAAIDALLREREADNGKGLP